MVRMMNGVIGVVVYTTATGQQMLKSLDCLKGDSTDSNLLAVGFNFLKTKAEPTFGFYRAMLAQSAVMRLLSSVCNV